MDLSVAKRALVLFEHILDLDARAQRQFLDKLQDVNLVRAVERLVRADSMASDPLVPLHQAVLESVTIDQAQPGQRIGSCVLIRPLGHGGMGEVWEARRELIDCTQRVALKLAHERMFNARARQHFAREQRVLARLDHPAIAQLLDAGVTEEGEAWFALEYIDGEPIHRYVQHHNLDATECVVLIEQVCHAIAHAHRSLVLHRDIKPANILVDRERRAHLLDFGIAGLLDEDDPSHCMVAHTPRYASPEQRRGKPLCVGSDIYQIGLLLHELVHDFLPNPTGPTRWRLCNSQDLAAIIQRATQDHVSDRYASVHELVEDLQCWREKRPIRARTGSLTYRFWRLLQRHRLTSLFAGLAGAMLITGIVTIGIQVDVAQHERRVALHRAHQAKQEAATSREVIAWLTEMFTAADPMATNRGDVSAREVMLATLARLQHRTDLDVAVRNRLAHHLANALNGLGELSAARDLLEAAVASGGNAVDQAFNLGYLAILKRLDGHPEKATQMLDRALHLSAGDSTEARHARLRALTERGLTEAWQGNYTEALSWQRRAQRLAAQYATSWRSEDVFARHNLAQSLIYLGRYKEAGDWLDSASTVASQNGEQFAAMQLRIEETRIYLLNRTHRFAEAFRRAESLIQELVDLYGKGSFRERQVRQFRARALDGLGRSKEASVELALLLQEMKADESGLMHRLNTASYLSLALLNDQNWPALAAHAQGFIESVERLPAVRSHYLELLAYAAYAELQLGHPDRARQFMTKMNATETSAVAEKLHLTELTTLDSH
jgi:serine/threonine protein kinase